MRSTWLVVPVVALASFVCGSFACSPHQVRTLERALPPAIEASCVLVRAFLNDGTAEEICATAEDLAPFVPELLSAREQPAQKEASARVVVAAALPAPARKLPRRRCVEWKIVNLADGGKEDSGGGSGADKSIRESERANR